MWPPKDWTDLKPSMVWLLVVSSLIVVSALDYATGVALSFSLFYLLPVMLAGRWLGYRVGVAVALLCASVWYGVELLSQTVIEPWISLWNGLVRLCFFLLFNHMQSLILEALVKEQQLARTDGLTGAINNRQFYALLEDELARHHRFDQTLSLGYLDVDDFKAVNELGGHNLGDRLLKEIVVTSQKTLRRVDTIARLGGDEFTVILPQTDKAAALKALTNLQNALNKRLKQFPGSASVSIGAVSCHKPELPVGALIKYADELMYRVKRSGKNGLLCEHIEPPNTVIEPRP